MEEDFKEWLRKMYYENCKERDIEGVPQFPNYKAYYREYPKWLKDKFNKSKGK